MRFRASESDYSYTTKTTLWKRTRTQQSGIFLKTINTLTSSVALKGLKDHRGKLKWIIAVLFPWIGRKNFFTMTNQVKHILEKVYSQVMAVNDKVQTTGYAQEREDFTWKVGKTSLDRLNRREKYSEGQKRLGKIAHHPWNMAEVMLWSGHVWLPVIAAH